MSNDISTQFTKEKNNKRGRHGVGGWKYEKVTQISPKDYGMFIQGKRKKKKQNTVEAAFTIDTT